MTLTNLVILIALLAERIMKNFRVHCSWDRREYSFGVGGRGSKNDTDTPGESRENNNSRV